MRVFLVIYLLHELLSVRQLVDQSLDDLKHGSGLHSVRRNAATQAKIPQLAARPQKLIKGLLISLTEAAVEIRRSAGS